jgi:hypothetical protein
MRQAIEAYQANLFFFFFHKSCAHQANGGRASGQFTDRLFVHSIAGTVRRVYHWKQYQNLVFFQFTMVSFRIDVAIRSR